MSLKLLHIGLCVQPPPINGFQKAFIEELGEENYREISCGDPNLNRRCVEIYNEFKPDIVFMQIQADGVISPEAIVHMKGSKIINWTGDIRQDTPQWMIDIAPNCISAFSNMKDVKLMREIGMKAEYLEIGYDPEIYCPEGDRIECPEIVFMANNYGDMFPLSTFRAAIVKTLKAQFKEKFAVYGNGWLQADGNLCHSQREEVKYYRGTKIAINCSHFKVERYSSDRLLRILGSGCFCLTHDFPGMDYVDGQHLVVFKNLHDLVDKIKYYICHDEERNEIAKRGQELVLGRNTFRHQVRNILSL